MPETGQLLSATLMDYALPRADMLPSFTTEISEVPSTSHPLGLRGGGEGGTTPALGAVVNAIVDALAELGVEHVELPATPERVWQAIRDARATPRLGIAGHRALGTEASLAPCLAGTHGMRRVLRYVAAAQSFDGTYAGHPRVSRAARSRRRCGRSSR